MEKENRLLIVLDIFIIIAAFIVAVVLAQSFETFINSDPVFLDIYSTDFSRPSKFILNLPIYVAIIGLLIMDVRSIPLKRRGEPFIHEI